MLGHADFYDKKEYHQQSVIDNVSLLTEDILEEINRVVVTCGHRLVKKNRPEDPLRCRADSAVAKTHVHWPTDVNLLWDAMPNPGSWAYVPGAQDLRVAQRHVLE